MSDRFREMSLDYEREGRALAVCQALFSPSLALITNLGVLLILLVGGRDVIVGAITVGTFVAMQRFVVQLSWPMEAIGWTVTMQREGAAAYRRLGEVLAVVPVESIRAPAVARERHPALTIEKLRFEYPTENGARGFSLELDGIEVPRGARIGIVGPVGSGKTTLFNLVLRLYEPPIGHVWLGGRDVASLPLAELRRLVGCVEQPAFLFSETVARNLALGCAEPPQGFQLDRAAATAAVLDEVLALEGGWETHLRERAVNLSGGQKQRLALARALVRRPELLLLDDCFSAVDVAVEERILDGLLRDRDQLTLLFASHRMSVMPRMDEVWLLDEGRLKARGTHGELLGGNVLYRSLWERSEREREGRAEAAASVQEGML